MQTLEQIDNRIMELQDEVISELKLKNAVLQQHADTLRKYSDELEAAGKRLADANVALQQHADEMEKAAKGVTEHEEGAITKLITALHNYEQFKSK